jgi:hypothetical protein
MTVRDYQFIVGAETSTLPAAGAPVDPSDTITLGYADDHYVQGGEPVADLTALAAVGSSNRADGDALLVLSSNTFYRFDSASAASADGLRVVAPASGSGRWFRVRPGETASNGDYAVAGDINVGGDAIITGNVEVTGNATINGTLTAINSTTLEVVDANILINNGGNTASADLADAGFTVEISDGTDAKVGYNSTMASKFMCGNIGSESEIITAGTTQTLTGSKSFDLAPTIIELASTPTTPAAGYQKIYPKTDGKFYKLDDAGLEQQLGSGAGGGSINFITNPDAETDTAGWAVYADAAATTPVDGTGGSANVTITRSTSSPLRGTASFLLTKDAANRQGEGTSFAFTLDSADVSKTIQISMDLSPSVNYAANDIGVYIYDVTNSVLIAPAAVNIAAANYTFQTTFVASTSTSYRLILHVASVSALAYTLKFDNVVVGPQLLTLGTAIEGTKSITFTPGATPFGTVTNAAYKYERVGNKMNVTGYFRAGTVTANPMFVQMPAGLTIDATATLTASNTGKLGDWYGLLVSTTGFGTGNVFGAVFFDGSDTSGFYMSTAGSSSLHVKSTANNLVSNSGVSFSASIPIAQWAGSDVYLSQAQPEYAYNSSTTAATDTTSFAYGPIGALVPQSALAGTIQKRVRFLTPDQPTDRITLQVCPNATGDRWIDLSGITIDTDGDQIQSYTRQNANDYGVSVFSTSSIQDYDVQFGRYILAIGATFGAAGSDWNSSRTFRYRVVKVPGQVQVASPVIPTATSMSDVSATALGLKAYSHGTNYNGGNSPTITLFGGGGTLSSIGFSKFIPKQLQDGSWVISGSFLANLSSASRNAPTFAIAGITFANEESFTFSASQDANFQNAVTTSGTGRLFIVHATVTTTSYRVNFSNLTLSAKPTWAY